MGTHATTRMTTKDDFIEMHTRWEGFVPDIISHIETSINDWENSIAYLRERMIKHPENIEYLSRWVDDLAYIIESYKKNPTIETASTLLCMRSFNHHFVLPNKTNEDTFQYWNKGHPDLVAFLDNDKFSFHETVMVKPTPKPIPDGFKVLRIYATQDDKINENEFIDLKYYGLESTQMFREILTLPLFWRELYTVAKYKESDDSAYLFDFDRNPVLHKINTLKSFYTMTEAYSSSEKNFNDDVPRTAKQRDEDFEDVSRMMIRMLPMEMSISSLASHIIEKLPANIQHMTESERLSDYEISLNVMLNTESRSSLLFCNVPSLSVEENQKLLTPIVNEYTYNVQRFINQYKLDAHRDIEFRSLFDYKDYIGFYYEKTIQILMEYQYELELKEQPVDD